MQTGVIPIFKVTNNSFRQSSSLLIDILEQAITALENTIDLKAIETLKTKIMGYIEDETHREFFIKDQFAEELCYTISHEYLYRLKELLFDYKRLSQYAETTIYIYMMMIGKKKKLKNFFLI